MEHRIASPLPAHDLESAQDLPIEEVHLSRYEDRSAKVEPGQRRVCWVQVAVLAVRLKRSPTIQNSESKPSMPLAVSEFVIIPAQVLPLNPPADATPVCRRFKECS